MVMLADIVLIAGLLALIVLVWLWLFRFQRPTTRRVEPDPVIVELASAPGYPLDRARHLASKGKVDEAVAVYKEIYVRSDHSPRPLFEAETLLELHGRYSEAIDLVRLILRTAAEEPHHWAEASLRLARLLDTHFDEHEAARDLWEKVNERMKHTRFGKEARENLYGPKNWFDAPQGLID